MYNPSHSHSTGDTMATRAAHDVSDSGSSDSGESDGDRRSDHNAAKTDDSGSPSENSGSESG